MKNKKLLAMIASIGSIAIMTSTIVGLSAWQVIVARTTAEPTTVGYTVEFRETNETLLKSLTILEIDSGFDLYTPESEGKHFDYWFYKTGASTTQSLSGASAIFKTIYDATSEKANNTIKLYASWTPYIDMTEYATIEVTAAGNKSYTVVVPAVTDFKLYNIRPDFLASTEYVSKYTYSATDYLPNDSVNLTTSSPEFSEMRRTTNRKITLVATIATKTS